MKNYRVFTWAVLLASLAGLGVTGSSWAAGSSAGGIWGISQPSGTDKLDEAQKAVSHEPAIQELLGDRSNQLMASKHVSSKGFETTKFKHFYKGIEVLGSNAFYDSGLDKEVRDDLVRFDLDVTPSLSTQMVVSLAKSWKKEDRKLLRMPELKILPSDDAQSARLIYWVSLDGTEKTGGANLLIDAHSGELVSEIPDWMTIAAVEVYDEADSTVSDPESGAPLNIDLSKMKHVVASGVPGTGADQSAKKAAQNAKDTLKYYLQVHERDSFDGQGTSSKNVVHVGEKFSNAFWSSQYQIMAYGDGDGKRFNDFTRSLDVAGHEMTHGVVSQTADLLYFSESGALNEALADFFGKMVEGKNDWIMGRELFNNPEESAQGIRNIKDPHAGRGVQYLKPDGTIGVKPYPVHMKERFIAKGECSGENDYCWVHVNSTIPSHALYQVYQAIGKDRTEALTYRVLSHYLNSKSGFRAFKKSMTKACGTMFDTQTCDKVNEGFAKVGL